MENRSPYYNRPENINEESKPRPQKAIARKPKEDKFSKYFREVKLDDGQISGMEKELHFAISKWLNEERGELESKLSRWNDLAEGITSFTDFPWEDAANLHIPLTEIHLNIIHAALRQTMFKTDPMWMASYYGLDPKGQQLALKQENFLNAKSKTEIPVVPSFSLLGWSALRDGTSVAQVQWVKDSVKDKEFNEYSTLEDFLEKFPTKEEAKESNISDKLYLDIIDKLSSGEPVELEEESEFVEYEGPRIDTIELNDFVMYPFSSVYTKLASFVGKRFVSNDSDMTMKEKAGILRSGTMDRIKKSKAVGRDDYYTISRDQIEGITRTDGSERIFYDGILRYDLNDDGIKENYLVIYDFNSNVLMQCWHYPYRHRKDIFIPIRPKKRPNRFLGRGIVESLEDVNLEINTTHNQRVNSRTITTVPTFLAKISAKNEFDPSRSDMKFKPARTYYLSQLDSVKQMEVRETDFSQTMNEENNLFGVADMLTGASQLRSGRETRLDPRAPALKVQLLLQQSNIRLDDYMEEMAGDDLLNEGFNAIGYHILELYKQFGEDDLDFQLSPGFRGTQETRGEQFSEGFRVEEFKRKEINLNKMKIKIAKTSVNQNPDILLQRWFGLYQILANEPLVGGNAPARRELVAQLLLAARAERLYSFLPLPAPTQATQPEIASSQPGPGLGQPTPPTFDSNAIRGALAQLAGSQELGAGVQEEMLQ